MYRILAAIDRNEDRIQKQLDTLEDFTVIGENMEVVILHIVDKERSIHLDGNKPKRNDIPNEVKEFQEKLNSLGLQNKIIMENGANKSDRILNTSEEVDANCILVSGRKNSPVGKAVFGSVAQSVIINSEMPTIIS